MRPILFILVGYPGAGKTTVSQTLHKLTGAEHLWADKVRKERFNEPNYSHAENTELYNHMNERTSELLQSGQSVIYDTNFNFFQDRQKMHQIAQQAGATAVLLWVQTPLEIAKRRATMQGESTPTRVLGNMSDKDFERLSGHLEEPTPQEAAIVLDGTKISDVYLQKLVLNN